jgi:hypothetical protein
MEIDERLETLCEQFAGLKETEKDYILEVSQTLAQSVKGTKPAPAWVERVMSEYKGVIKES